MTNKELYELLQARAAFEARQSEIQEKGGIAAGIISVIMAILILIF